MNANGYAFSAETPPAPGDETALVQAAQESSELFGAVYRRYLDGIYRYLQLRVGPDDAADLAQQVFLRAFTALPKYKAKGVPFSAWLFRIARNLATDHHRASYRMTDELLPNIILGGTAGAPEQAALQAEQLEHLRSLLRELDGEKRELLAMRFAAGLSSREIGAVIGKKEEAVKKQLGRILRTLKEKYGEY